jgi:hypothetical protein
MLRVPAVLLHTTFRHGRRAAAMGACGLGVLLGAMPIASAQAGLGEFETLPASTAKLTSVAVNPETNVIYAQQNEGKKFFSYNPSTREWKELAEAPVSSGNNGGATYAGGRIYTSYTGDKTTLGVYEIETNEWKTIPNPLEEGTADITTAGGELYLVAGEKFVKYNTGSETKKELAKPPSFILEHGECNKGFEAWGGIQPYQGKIYGDQGNECRGFAIYDIKSNTWEEGPRLPEGATAGSALDPVTGTYFAEGNYPGGTRVSTDFYRYNIAARTWTIATLPFTAGDTGMAYVWAPGLRGVYVVEGEKGTAFSRYSTPEPAGFEGLPASPVALTSVAVDPTTNIIYAQENQGKKYFSYNPVTRTWIELPQAPLSSGNNGGGTYLNGKIYVSYTGNKEKVAVYDIASQTWSTIANPLGEGTADITAAGGELYMTALLKFVKYNPGSGVTTELATPPAFVEGGECGKGFEKWGGLQPYQGKLYGDAGNECKGFAAYTIATNTWEELPRLPDGAVAGSALDPITGTYFAEGNYSEGANYAEGLAFFFYRYDIATRTWTTSLLPFPGGDTGMAYVSAPGLTGVYVAQGEGGPSFARYATPEPAPVTTTTTTTTTTTSFPTKPPVLKHTHVNAKTGEITVEYEFPEPGEAEYQGEVPHGAQLASVGTPALSKLAETSKKSKRCRRGFVKKHKRCVSNGPVVYGKGRLVVPLAGVYKIHVKPSGRVLAALKRGKTLTVRLKVVFTPAHTTDHIVVTSTARVHLQKPKHRKHHKHR